MKKSNGGYLIVTAVLILTVLAILVPAFVHFIQKESKDSVSEAKKTRAFQLAEAGQDRGAWKLRESKTMWTNATSGITITNYNGDTEFADVAGGTYKIDISPGPGPGEVTVVSKGKATDTSFVRAIQAVYSKSSAVGAMSVSGGIEYKPNLKVHWGPVVSYTAITQSPSDYYPRKYSAGQITGRDTVNDATNGAEPGGNWATYDYSAFYDLGPAPVVDLDSYRDKARNSCVPTLRKTSGSGAAAHYTGGGCDSGYYTASVRLENADNSTYVLNCSTCVIFIEGDIAAFPDADLRVEALLATGDSDFNSDYFNYVATIPANAQDQYLNTSGPAPTAATFWTTEGWTNGGSYTITNCGMFGFLYVGGTLSNAGGNSKIAGAVYVAGDVTVNTLSVYYDSNVANNIEFTNPTIGRDSWDEVVTGW